MQGRHSSFTRRAIAALAASLLTSAVQSGPSAAAEPAARRPNFVFLCSDDQRPDTIHALGNAVIQTPHLDRLVREGTSLARAITAHPLCVPSRAEMLTGCTSFRTGIGYGRRLNPALALWPETLRQAGYHTWYVGKWHTEGTPHQRGYEETNGWYASGMAVGPQYDHRGKEVTGYRGWQFRTDAGVRQSERGVGLTPDISADFADAAIELIERRPQRPFFLHVNFTAPHDPLFWPPGYENKYDPARMPLPANFLPEHPFDHGNLRGRDEVLMDFPRTADEVRRELAVYYAVISHMDEQIGRILAALDATGQAADTVVIFSSDHGLAVGSHGLRGKQNMYEHTINVPLVLRGPGIPSGARRDAQCYLRDLFPTTCELAGVPIPDTVQGRSIVPLLRGQTEAVYPEVYACFLNVQRMVRTDRWKLIYYPHIDRYQLFDVKNDPDELHDLVDQAEHAATVAELKARLQAWRRANDDPLPASG